ncbi:hypothetical protein RI129_009108 [Pyrocoelia pectoralis]|uniref:Uncharacterized protein n=1 Tax=Pyrocoelia pectoralis TaxID=417401 RepID=A0AAN7VCC7_9COLE
MSADIFDNRDAYLQNTYFQHHKREYGDYTAFYITVTVCTILFTFILVLNIVLGCCSRYSTYWNDRHTGNRWLVSLWTATPHNQPSLDYTELQWVNSEKPKAYNNYPPPPSPLQPRKEVGFVYPPPQPVEPELFELQQKRESAI